jgi:predicted metal-dependent phosphoesterase TrpH
VTRIDLHTHSTRSDGTDSPTELIENAKAEGLDVVALTDHDNAAGWDEARVAAERVGIRLIEGMEISTEVQGRSVHLLAYGLDPGHPELAAELVRVIDGRSGRVPKFIEKFKELGLDVSEEEILAKAGDAEAIGRPHIADILIDRGIVATRDEAFASLLVPGGEMYVPRYSIDLADAVRLVKAAGGKAVIAHPWSRGSKSRVTAELIESLIAEGLVGLEADHSDHDEAERKELRGIAEELDLVVTGSSDYHGTGKSEGFALGTNLTDPEELEKLDL